MRTIYDPSLKATVTLDDSGQVRGINHLDEYREIEHLRGREAATAYVRDIAGKLNIASESLRSIEQPVSYLDPQAQDVEGRRLGWSIAETQRIPATKSWVSSLNPPWLS